MAKCQEVKQHIHMSGEFGVVSELFRRNIQATITYGNSKKADVFVISTNGAKAAKIEVKTSVEKRWIVSEKQASTPFSHVVWVFVYMSKPINIETRAQVAEAGQQSPSYHILSAKEVEKLYLSKIAVSSKSPIVFEFADVQCDQNLWCKVRDALDAKTV